MPPQALTAMPAVTSEVAAAIVTLLIVVLVLAGALAAGRAFLRWILTPVPLFDDDAIRMKAIARRHEAEQKTQSGSW